MIDKGIKKNRRAKLSRKKVLRRREKMREDKKKEDMVDKLKKITDFTKHQTIKTEKSILEKNIEQLEEMQKEFDDIENLRKEPNFERDN